MKIELWIVGKTRVQWVRDGEAHYLKRCQRFATISHALIPAEKSGNAAHIVRSESDRLLARLEKSRRAATILLDERGKQMTSEEMAGYLRESADQHGNNLRFIIGGAYGVGAEVRSAVDSTLALSQLTFPHELVRVIFLEQLYRSFTILHGQSYHHA